MNSDAERRFKRQKLEDLPWNTCKAFRSTFYNLTKNVSDVLREETVSALYEKLRYRRWVHGTV